MAKPWNVHRVFIAFDELENKWALSVVPQVGDVLVLLCSSYENALKILIEVLQDYLVKEKEENAKNL